MTEKTKTEEGYALWDYNYGKYLQLPIEVHPTRKHANETLRSLKEIEVPGYTKEYKENFGVIKVKVTRPDNECMKIVTEEEQTKRIQEAEKIMTLLTPKAGVCSKCGCTDEDCSQCIKAQGHPCSWANPEHTLCTRCAK